MSDVPEKKWSDRAHDVILQVLTDTLKIQLDGDAGSGQNIFRSNTAVHQDIWTADGTRSQDDLLADVDGRNGAAFDVTELNTGSGHVVIEEDLSDGGVGQDVQIGARGQRIDVGGAGIRTRPVVGVNGGSGNESAPTLASGWIRAFGNTHGLKGGDPIAHDRRLADACLVSGINLELGGGGSTRLTSQGNSRAMARRFRDCLGRTGRSVWTGRSGLEECRSRSSSCKGSGHSKTKRQRRRHCLGIS